MNEAVIHQFIPHPYDPRKCGHVNKQGVVCAYPADIHASPATEDRATARSLNAHEVFLWIDEFESQQDASFHVNSKRQLAEFIFTRIQPGQKRIEALEAALYGTARRVILEIDGGHCWCPWEQMEDPAKHTEACLAARAALKGDSHEATN